MAVTRDPETVKKNVREGYAAIAQGTDAVPADAAVRTR